MSIARLRALTHVDFRESVIRGPVEMSIARLRALTHSRQDRIHPGRLVEMSIARLRALTPQIGRGLRRLASRRNEYRPIKGIDMYYE